MIKIKVVSEDGAKSFDILLNIDNDGMQTIAYRINSTEMLRRVWLLQEAIPFAKVEVNVSGSD